MASYCSKIMNQRRSKDCCSRDEVVKFIAIKWNFIVYQL